VDEILSWKEKTHPVDRFRAYMTDKGWWTAEQETELGSEERKEVLKAMVTAEEKDKPEALADLFQDVYDEVPANLVRQREELKVQMAKYPDHYTLADGH
jgi:2-oxoisovalerate dehydrogenase E1 component alpha subunit